MSISVKTVKTISFTDDQGKKHAIKIQDRDGRFSYSCTTCSKRSDMAFGSEGTAIVLAKQAHLQRSGLESR